LLTFGIKYKSLKEVYDSGVKVTRMKCKVEYHLDINGGLEKVRR